MCEFKSLREERMMGGIAEGWFASNFVELFIYRSRFWRFYSPKRISCFDEGLRSGGIGFILGAVHKVRHARACFKKNSSLRIWPKNFRTTFFRNFTPKSTISIRRKF